MRLIHAVHSQNHMNTTFVFRVSVPETERRLADVVLERSLALVGQLEGELSEFLPASPVHQLNGAAVGAPVTFTKAGWELWDRARRLKERTQGHFDPLWKSPGGELGWDAETRTLWKLTPESHLGFGAIGKGFALDRVREQLEQEGLENYILSAGGSSQILSGFSAPQTPWTWGWSWSRDGAGEEQGLEFTHTSGRGVALGVSGFHEQGRHIQTDSPYVTALVAERRATEADGLSTALLAGGWKNLDWFEEGTALATVDENQQPRWNGIFQGLWGAVGSLGVLCSTALGEEEEALDLSDLGFDDFTPYLVDRDPIWILLPLLSLVLVGLHLMQPKRPKLGKESWEKPK